MARKASAIVAPNLRIREELRRRLEGAAKRHAVSLNAEMTHRLERSFELDASRSNESIAQDIEQNWLRFGERFLALELGDEILSALEARDYNTAHNLAVTLRKTQEAAARRRAEKMGEQQ